MQTAAGPEPPLVIDTNQVTVGGYNWLYSIHQLNWANYSKSHNKEGATKTPELWFLFFY